MAAPLINPDLDTGALRETFLREGRVKIHDVLRPDFAEAIHDCLANDVPWRLAYYQPELSGTAEASSRLSPAEQRRLGPEGLEALVSKVAEEAGSQFQYLYDAYDVLDARRRGLDPGLLLQEFLSFVGSDALFHFVQEVSGDTAFNRVDCHACRYRPGHFLREHSDQSPFEQRHMAYVFYFTRDWHVDFGGVTHFRDDAGRVTDSLVPDYNSLTLFRVPVAHCVSQVASFAPRPRLSITGWFTRYD